MIWLGTIFAVIGLWQIGFALLSHRRAQVALRWPATPGKVLASSVREESGESTTYKPEILYEYHVDSRRHSAKVWRFGTVSSASKSKVEAIIAEYPVGKDITVFFNPQDLTDAVLEPGKANWVLPCVFGLVFASIGTGVTCGGISTYLKDQHAKSWPTTTGQIVHSSVVQGSDSDGDTTYSPQIRYSYRVNDHQHIGSVWKFESSTTSRTEADQAVALYRPGNTVTVFFNPDDPEEAVLEPGQVQAGFPVLVVILLAACLAGFYAFKRSRSVQWLVRQVISPSLRTPAH